MVSSEKSKLTKCERLLTPEEVSTLLGLSRIYVIRKSRLGHIPSLKIGKVYRYRLSTLQSWVAARETTSIDIRHTANPKGR